MVRQLKILILGTVPNDLLNFRADLIKDILDKNYKVSVSSSLLDAKSREHMKNLYINRDYIFKKTWIKFTW